MLLLAFIIQMYLFLKWFQKLSGLILRIKKIDLSCSSSFGYLFFCLEGREITVGHPHAHIGTCIFSCFLWAYHRFYEQYHRWRRDLAFKLREHGISQRFNDNSKIIRDTEDCKHAMHVHTTVSIPFSAHLLLGSNNCGLLFVKRTSYNKVHFASW